MFWIFGPKACGVLAPWSGTESTASALGGDVLTTGPPREVLAYFFILFFIYFLFFFIVVGFAIHWNETAMGLHVFPIPIPPPTSLSTRYL